MLVNYRDYLTVTRQTGKSKFASEGVDRMVINVSDVNLPIPHSPDKSAKHPSPQLGPCVFRVEFDRAGEASTSPLPLVILLFFSPPLLLPLRSLSVFPIAGFLRSSPPLFHSFLRPLLRSQGFMSFVEDAGVTGELLSVRNKVSPLSPPSISLLSVLIDTANM